MENWSIEQYKMQSQKVDLHNENKCPNCSTIIFSVCIVDGCDRYTIFPEIEAETTYSSGDYAFDIGNSPSEKNHWKTYFNHGRCPKCGCCYTSLEIDYSEKEHPWLTLSIFANEDDTNLYQEMVLYNLTMDNQIVGYCLFNADAEHDGVRGVYAKAWFTYYRTSRGLEMLEAIGRIYINSSSTLINQMISDCK